MRQLRRRLPSRSADPGGLWVLGLGHYDQNLRIKDLDRDAVDVNVHYFITSHLEAMLVTRLQTIGWGSGGPGSGWAFGQIHYRL